MVVAHRTSACCLVLPARPYSRVSKSSQRADRKTCMTLRCSFTAICLHGIHLVGKRPPETCSLLDGQTRYKGNRLSGSSRDSVLHPSATSGLALRTKPLPDFAKQFNKSIFLAMLLERPTRHSLRLAHSHILEIVESDTARSIGGFLVACSSKIRGVLELKI